VLNAIGFSLRYYLSVRSSEPTPLIQPPASVEMVNFRDPAVVAKEARASTFTVPITVLEGSLTPCLCRGCYQVLERGGWSLLVGQPGNVLLPS